MRASPAGGGVDICSAQSPTSTAFQGRGTKNKTAAPSATLQRYNSPFQNGFAIVKPSYAIPTTQLHVAYPNTGGQILPDRSRKNPRMYERPIAPARKNTDVIQRASCGCPGIGRVILGRYTNPHASPVQNIGASTCSSTSLGNKYPRHPSSIPRLHAQ